MDTFEYTCSYCHNLFIPRRRYSQKYCSNSCRSKAYHRRQIESKGTKLASPKNHTTTLPQIVPVKKESPLKQSIDKMSVAGVGNAAAGNLIADMIKYALQGNGNHPATKNDIAALFEKLDRYHLITNLPPRPFGRLPYFDLQTNMIVYF